MLTRRGFAGVAGCAICSLAGFAATEAFAQGSATTTANGVTRKISTRTDGPASGYETMSREGVTGLLVVSSPLTVTQPGP